MPVKKNPDGNDWCFGSKCGFKTKKAAEKAEKAYYTKKVTKSMKVIKKSENILKATSSDVKGYLRDAIKRKWEFEGGWFYGVDYSEDDGYVYFTVEYYDNSYFSISYRSSYTRDGVNVTLGDEIEEVKKETVYTVVEDSIQKDYHGSEIIKELKDFMKDLFKVKKEKELLVIKQFQDEEMIAIEPLYTLADEADGHREGMTSDTIEKMVNSANKAIEKGNLSGGLFHKENTEDIQILKCWVQECDCIIGDTKVSEGQPIAKIQFHNEDLWEMRKSGILKGLSIGAKGKRVENEE